MAELAQCDLNTGGFSSQLPASKTIKLHTNKTEVGYAEYPGVGMKGLLRKLSRRIDSEQCPATPLEVLRNLPAWSAVPHNPTEAHPIITHDELWPRMGRFLREGDIVVTDVGTSSFGIWSTRFPPRVTALTQLLWGSLGWSVGACQGASLAARDNGQDRRTILFVGDGALQLSVQELSTMIRHKLNITM